MRGRRLFIAAVLVVAVLPAAGIASPDPLPETRAGATTPVAVDEATYQAYGRVFPDPHGCFVQGGEAPVDTAISPWAKGRVCAVDYLSYTDVTEGARFLSRRFPDLVEVVRLDEAYGNPDYKSAGIARPVAVEDDGNAKALGRDKSPLYLYKVTNKNSDVPEAEREHFAFSMAIHGLERAGLEGGVRAMEDLVSWAACEIGGDRADTTPACATDGPFPKKIVEGDTDRPVPTALETLDRSVIYFFAPNPDGWRYGTKRPAEVRDGDPNANFLFGPSHSRYNGHGVDLNRDWPTVGYTLKSHQPWSEPETRAFGEVFLDIKSKTAKDRFAGGIDLHGMLNASAFSYTLLGADQRDYRKNAITVETSLRTWEDQTQRLTWSPYIGDTNGDGEQDRPAPIPVADEWGTVFDTLGYTITGGLGFWMDDSRIGLGGVGINNEMALSHMAPNNIYEPALIQTHIDGNKGLIYSQISALLYEQPVAFKPTGKIGYVFNPKRVTKDGHDRPTNPGLPAQSDIEVLLPCGNDVPPTLPGSCREGSFSVNGANAIYEFEVKGPADGVWNGGMTVKSTAAPQFVGHQVAVHAGVILEHFDEAENGWATVKTLSRTATTFNDPAPGRWRVRITGDNAASMPRRLIVDFDAVTAEESPGQIPISASSMDFYTDLNEYVPEGAKLEELAIQTVLDGEGLRDYDTVLVTNNLGRAEYLRTELGLSVTDVTRYFANLRAFAEGGGNLVLTDAALSGLTDMGLVAANAVQRQEGLAGFYAFRTAGSTVTYTDPETYPLAAGVDLPGAAEREQGSRQAVEPPTLGFSPDGHAHARMPFWGVQRQAWEALCDKAQPTHCTTAATASQGQLASVGEIGLGDGVVRIVGALLPDPNPVDDDRGDVRFGLGSHALTYTAYQVFENLVDYARD
ncbi:MAG TPA: M14 family zinc carboxypeptidase [Egibacteraceae bacterium]|nr:M14 family zinc carboxypeptidase [Egibacteraceae bacterium]